MRRRSGSGSSSCRLFRRPNRAEVALQPGPEMLESRQPQGLIDRPDHPDWLSLQVFEADLEEPPVGFRHRSSTRASCIIRLLILSRWGSLSQNCGLVERTCSCRDETSPAGRAYRSVLPAGVSFGKIVPISTRTRPSPSQRSRSSASHPTILRAISFAIGPTSTRSDIGDKLPMPGPLARRRPLDEIDGPPLNLGPGRAEHRPAVPFDREGQG